MNIKLFNDLQCEKRKKMHCNYKSWNYVVQRILNRSILKILADKISSRQRPEKSNRYVCIIHVSLCSGWFVWVSVLEDNVKLELEFINADFGAISSLFSLYLSEPFLSCFDLFILFEIYSLSVHQLSEQLSLFFSVKPLVSILSARSFQTPRFLGGRRIRSWELSFSLLLGRILWRLSKTGQNVKECYQCGGHCLTYERPT